MIDNYTPELQALLGDIETALLRASQNARQLAEQTGTRLVIRERHDHEGNSLPLRQLEDTDDTPPPLKKFRVG